jgi:nifR3 family TIM-barrel protein
VVAKNGGSSLLRDCPLLERVALAVVHAVGHSHPDIPVTAKIRIGWDDKSINAPEVGRLLEGCGIQRLAVHGRTKAQGYSGLANWDVIAEVAASVRIPVIGNGDIASARDVLHRRDTAGVAGVMIGRAAMSGPWLFAQAKALLENGELLPDPPLATRWDMILRHCKLAVAGRRRGGERAAMASMRSRLMAYTRGMEGSRLLRGKLSHVASLMELEEIAAMHLRECELHEPAELEIGSS